MRTACLLSFATLCATAFAQESDQQESKQQAEKPEPIAAANFRLPEGFEAELVYNVPLAEQGSWVAMAVEPDGNLLASDQYGGLYRVDLSAVKPNAAVAAEQVKISKVAAPLGMIQGICPSEHGLYVNVNGANEGENGVYRLRDGDGDGSYEQVEHLIPVSGGSEHGPHAIIPGRDGRFYAAFGNACEYPENIDHYRVPKVWGSDHLLGRMPDARGFMATNMRPGGYVLSFDKDAEDVELVALGFRNHYDIAFNDRGDLFTFDADMEWDVGTPWYRPTRVNHVVSGVDFGWRNGTGKYPDYYPDSFGSVVDIGFGSPTGVAFAYGTNFPPQYRDALMIGDWSYGKVYAVALEPAGGSYTGTFSTFLSAAPLPVTDMVVRPQDRCMYVSVGGRKTQSALYRVRYTGPQVKEEKTSRELTAEAKLRRELEQYHRAGAGANAIELALKHLGSPDRAVRSAARIVLEHQPAEQWKDAAMKLSEPTAKIYAAVALARVSGEADIHQLRSKLNTDQSSGSLPEPEGDAAASSNTHRQLRSQLIDSLASIDWNSLDDLQRLELLRAYGLIVLRLGEPEDASRDAILAQIDSHFPTPTGSPLVNRELAAILLRLNAPEAVARTVAALQRSPSAEDQIQYAFCLREVEQGWTDQTRRAYFQWFFDIASARGGESFGGFIENIRQVAIAKLDDATRKELTELVDRPVPKVDPQQELKARPFVKKWTVDELAAELEKNEPADFENGSRMFAAAQCYQCHRFRSRGGIQGPDLTAAGGRFSQRDLLRAIVEPSHEISDQYQATQFLTENDEVVVGRIANMHGERLSISTNMFDPEAFTNLNRNEIVEMRPSPVSMMHEGLLDTLTADDVRDLVAYLRSGGDPKAPVFASAPAAR